MQSVFRRLGVLTGLLILMLSLTLSGCGSAPTPPPSTQVPPTPTVNPDLFPTLTTPPPTQVTPVPKPALETRFYTHPNEMVRLIPPKGWIIQAGNAFVEFSDPTGKGKMIVRVVNTGQPLDNDSFERFVQAREENVFASTNDHTPIDWEMHKNLGEAIVTKSSNRDSRTEVVTSAYHRLDQAVYILDFWTDQSVYEGYRKIYDIILDQTTFDNRDVSTLEVYAPEESFLFTTDLFTVTVPSSWMYSHRTAIHTMVDTFASPDELAFIQAGVYDDGLAISFSTAGTFMRTILRNYYAEDIIITSDVGVGGGRERLKWYSSSAGYNGDTVFEVRDTAFRFFTTLYDSDATAIYANRLEQVMNDYINR